MGALNSKQFAGHGEQLAMFMTPNEIIDNVHKIDSRLYGERHTYSPRDQWEDPDSGYGQSLADDKMDDIDNGGRDYRESVARMHPIEITHGRDGMALTDGHHRLAHAQYEDKPLIPVKHRLPYNNVEYTSMIDARRGF